MDQMARAACEGDHRWLLATYAPQLLILARTASDEKMLAFVFLGAALLLRRPALFVRD
jgi:hypothetical protein